MGWIYDNKDNVCFTIFTEVKLNNSINVSKLEMGHVLHPVHDSNNLFQITLAHPLLVAVDVNLVILSLFANCSRTIYVQYQLGERGPVFLYHQRGGHTYRNKYNLPSLLFLSYLHTYTTHRYPTLFAFSRYQYIHFHRAASFIIVRRAGLVRSQQDSERWWSVPFTCAWLYMSFLLFCLICGYSSQFSILFWIMYLL